MARLVPIPLVVPGSLGINRDQEFALNEPRWSVRALNAVLDRAGQLAARKGWAIPAGQTAMASSPAVAVVHEFIKDDGTAEIIAAANNKIFKGLGDYTAGANDITSSSAPTANNWQFVNFNSKVLGWQDGHVAIEWDGTGDFANISAASGTLPTGNAVCAAFGRVWASYADKQTIGYCALLDETEWDVGSGGGTINMRHLWTGGMDEIVAIAALGSKLLVFGKRHIIIFEDGSGSELGLDPTQMIVSDTIEGTGCIARDSIAALGEGDLAYLSAHGVQLLGRVIADKNNPLNTITRHYKTQLASILAGEDLSKVRGAFSSGNFFYLLTFPASSLVLCLDTRLIQDDSGPLARLTEWSFSPMVNSLCSRANGDLLLGFNGSVGVYSGYADNSTGYDFVYESVWLAMDPEIESLLKIIKELRAQIFTSAGSLVTFSWGFDFGVDEESAIVELEAGSAAEFGEAEFGEDEFSGGNFLRVVAVDGAGEGKYLKVGLATTVNGFSFAVQQIQLYAKLGRLN